MDALADIRSVITFFQAAFTFIFALALTESFKQFVADKAEKEEDRHIHWERIWSLLSFLLLILPFFQGISRYFYVEYISKKPPEPYSAWLMFDAVSFLVEAALFFVMSRTIAPVLWRRFYYCVLWLCTVDSLWAFVSVLAHSVPIDWWLGLNVAAVIVFFVFTQVFSSDRAAVRTGFALVLLRTTLDYYLTWSFYFPHS